MPDATCRSCQYNQFMVKVGKSTVHLICGSCGMMAWYAVEKDSTGLAQISERS